MWECVEEEKSNVDVCMYISLLVCVMYVFVLLLLSTLHFHYVLLYIANTNF